MNSLSGRTLLMSGGSRGIGLSIALRAAREGANVAFIAKSDVADPRLPGTVHTAAAEIEAAGGSALPIVGDIRNAEAVEDAVRLCVDTFGGIDIVVNNASAIDLRGWQQLEEAFRPASRCERERNVHSHVGSIALPAEVRPRARLDAVTSDQHEAQLVRDARTLHADEVVDDGADPGACGAIRGNYFGELSVAANSDRDRSRRQRSRR